MSEVDKWAKEVNLPIIIKFITGDAVMVEAMLRQAFEEGAYRQANPLTFARSPSRAPERREGEVMPGKDIPEIVYKTFFDPDHVAHVAPAVEDKLMVGHRLNLDCACRPVPDRNRYILIIIHHVIH